MQIVIDIVVMIPFSIFYMLMYKIPFLNVCKMIFLIFVFVTFVAIFTFILSKTLFTEILKRTFNNQDHEGKRVTLGRKLYSQILPLLFVVTFFSILLGYSRVLEERGNFISGDYKTILDSKIEELKSSDDINEMFHILSSVQVNDTKICDFIRSPDKKIETSDGSNLGTYFVNYMNEFSQNHNGRVYSNNGEYNGVEIRLERNDGVWIVGVKYNVMSYDSISFFLVSFFILIVFCIFILVFIAKTITTDISFIGNKLMEIANGEILDIEQKIPVTSNDEIADLVIAFNKIREHEFQLDKLKTDYFANLSHEFKTPINVMLATIQLNELYLKNGPATYLDKSSKNMKTIRQNCFRLLRLIDNLIDITKIDAEFIQVNLQRTNIINLVETITLSVEEYAKTKNIKLEFKTSIPRKFIYCDLDKMERIMLNLLSNAIKFTKPQGTIFVRIYENEKSIFISVKDSGIGISKDKHEIIFERFKQLDQSLTRNYEGSGIGLSIVKSFVEMHKGKINVESIIGMGSEFIIELPIENFSDEEYKQTNTLNEIRSAGNVEKLHIEFSDIYL